MAFVDVMLGAVSVPLFFYLKVGFQLWSITQEVGVVLNLFYLHFDIIFLQASLISAVFISCERFYAVYRPLKHRTLSTASCTLFLKSTYLKYRKIPKISPGAYIFQRPFLRGLFLEGLIYGGKFTFHNRLG